MARSAMRNVMEEAAQVTGKTASRAAGRARRTARRAMAEASQALDEGHEAYRTVFHDLADEAERKLAETERRARGFGQLVLKEVTSRPGAAVLSVAVAAALGASLAGWMMTRRR